jgi:hypothetical protein
VLVAGPRCSRSWLALKRLASENCAVLRDLVAERDAEMKSLRNSLAVLQPVSAAHARAATTGSGASARLGPVRRAAPIAASSLS